MKYNQNHKLPGIILKGAFSLGRLCHNRVVNTSPPRLRMQELKELQP